VRKTLSDLKKSGGKKEKMGCPISKKVEKMGCEVPKTTENGTGRERGCPVVDTPMKILPKKGKKIEKNHGMSDLKQNIENDPKEVQKKQ